MWERMKPSKGADGHLAGGHILLEDVPGVGKTTLALGFSRVMNLDYRYAIYPRYDGQRYHRVQRIQ